MNILCRYSAHDLLYIAICSALGLAIKPIVTPLIHLVSAPLMIPGGSLAGGFYMLWIGLAVALTGKFGTAFLVGVVQALVMISLGYFGSHGAVSLISYSFPGIVVEIAALFFRNKKALIPQIIFCTTANCAGALIVTLLVMRLPFLPLCISLLAAAISGMAGGVIAYKLLQQLATLGIITR